jgi:lipopolysaccharide export system permease protein
MLRIFDIYLLKNLLVATAFIAVTLAFIVFLTQSLRFLEIVINAGAGSSFWILTALALPRFLEVILPLSMLASVLFLYNKMMLDSELVAIRAAGLSHLSLAKPALVLGAALSLLMMFITLWLAPYSANKMHKMRLELTAEFSSVLFREGIFNPLGRGLTVYIRDRSANGELMGIMIHDTRDSTKPPSTVLAKRGMIIDSDQGPQVIVFDGARHEFDPKSGILQRLAFVRYTIQLPENEAIPQRWQQPDERTLYELLTPDLKNPRDMDNLRQFSVEIHRRITTPLLPLVFASIALAMLLLGKSERRGQARNIIGAIAVVIAVQSLYIAASNMARNSDFGIVLMYLLTLLPMGFSLFFMTRKGQTALIRMRYREKITL